MLVQQVALPRIPSYARVPSEALDAVLRRMSGDPGQLQCGLDRGFRTMEQKHPALAEYLAKEVFSLSDRTGQSITYFVTVSVYLSFIETFASRLGPVSEHDLRNLTNLLLLDGELRNTGRCGDSYSEDLVGITQQALCDFARSEVEQSLSNQPDDSTTVPYETILLEILTLSLAVAPPSTPMEAELF